MEIYHIVTIGKLFPESVCSVESIFFHGTHENNAEKIESDGIQRPRYPKQIRELINKYRETSMLLGLSHAFSTYKKTYQGKDNITFLTKICTQAAGYIQGVSGEEITTLKVSIHNLRLLFDNPEHLKQKLYIARRKAEQAPLSEKEFYKKRLKAYQNLERYKPLLEESVSVLQSYPKFFEEPTGSGIVYAVNGKDIQMDNQGWQGYSTNRVPVKNLIAKAKFNLELRNRFSTCRTCKNEEPG